MRSFKASAYNRGKCVQQKSKLITKTRKSQYVIDRRDSYLMFVLPHYHIPIIKMHCWW